MSKRNLIIIAILVIVIGGIFFYSPQLPPHRETSLLEDNEDQSPAQLKERQAVIDVIEGRLSSLSPVNTEADTGWSAERFEFIDDAHFYVEYSDGVILRRLLLEIKDKGSYKVVGFFEPGENLWNLVSGKDPYFGEPVDIYEKDKQGEWVQVN